MVSLSIRDLSSRRYTTKNRWCSKKVVPAQSLKALWLKLAGLADTDLEKQKTVNCSQMFKSIVLAVCAKQSYALNYAGTLSLVDRRTPFTLLIALERLSVDGNRRPSSHWVVA
jgi:hypothetical protein